MKSNIEISIPKTNKSDKKTKPDYSNNNNNLSDKFEAEDEKELIQNNNYEMFSEFFDENKFQMRNDFNRKKCEEFLKEKDICLQNFNLDDKIPEEALQRSSTQFTFGFP